MHFTVMEITVTHASYWDVVLIQTSVLPGKGLYHPDLSLFEVHL